MTMLEPGTVTTLMPPVHWSAVTAEALHHAVSRDLARLTRVLAEPLTAVRRVCLIKHIGFVLDALAAHHRLLDDVIWPAAITARPDLTELANRVVLTHDELAEPVTTLRNASLAWREDPQRRLTVLSAVRELSSALAPVLDQDSDLAPLIEDVFGASIPARPSPAAPARAAVSSWAAVPGWVAVPTRLARRTFWMLDELDPRQARLLTDRTPRSVMWVLRNGFSGAYNRSAYLMWFGGGTGPAV